MLTRKSYIIIMLLIATTRSYGMDIIDNAPFDNSPEAIARRNEIIARRVEANTRKKRQVEQALPHVQTPNQARVLGLMADNCCAIKVAHKAAKLAKRFEDEDRAPGIAPRRLALDFQN